MKLEEIKNSVSLSMGPGQHVDKLKQVLSKNKLLKDFFVTYPDFVVESYEDGSLISKKEIRSFRPLQRVISAVTVPFSNTFSRDFFQLVKDYLISSNIEFCKIFLAWSFVSSQSIKKLKKLGSKIVLECQMSHIDVWLDIIREEKKMFKIEDSYSNFSNFLVKRAKEEYENADVIKVLSSYSKKSFVDKGFPENKIKVVPFGIEKDFAKDHTTDFKRKSDNKKVILYVGRLELLKGVQYLLKAFSMIKGKNLELWLVGPVLPEAKSFLKSYGDDERVKILGVIQRNELKKIYSNADLFVFPSLNDAFGLVVLEAMSFGLPVITTENSCSDDVITDGLDGFIVPIRDPVAIRERTEILLQDDELRYKIGKRAKEKVVKNFSEERYESLNLLLLEEI